MLTLEQISSIIPHTSAARLNLFLPLLNVHMPAYAINNAKRQACFIAQVAHESGGFVYTQELASGAAYEGRASLGNNQPGDGVRFKGRGLIQITGRANYRDAGAALQLDLLSSPILLEQPAYAVQSACWWWNMRGLNEMADRLDMTAITRRINGGLNGLADRMAYFSRAKKVFKVV